jgi:hypothetical protein
MSTQSVRLIIKRIGTDALIEHENMLVICKEETVFTLKDREITTLQNTSDVEHFEHYWDPTYGTIVRTPCPPILSLQTKQCFRYVVVHRNLHPIVLHQVYKEYFFMIPSFLFFLDIIEKIKPDIIGIDYNKIGNTLEEMLFWLPGKTSENCTHIHEQP